MTMTMTVINRGEFNPGILSAPQIEAMVDQGVIRPAVPIADGQIQPASIDLRLGARVWRIRASFLPGEGMSVNDKLTEMAMHEIDISHGAVLELSLIHI